MQTKLILAVTRNGTGKETELASVDVAACGFLRSLCHMPVCRHFQKLLWLLMNDGLSAQAIMHKHYSSEQYAWDLVFNTYFKVIVASAAPLLVHSAEFGDLVFR